MSTLKLLLFRQPGVGILLFNYFLMNTGFFLMMPFVALHGTRDLGLSAAMAGLVLGIRQFTQQGLAVFGGALGDRIGYKPTLAIGLLVRAIGFASFAYATDLPSLTVAALIAAFGGAFFESSGNAALATLTPIEHRPASFSLYGISSRLGSAVGPALGIWLLQINFATLSLVAASFYIVGVVLLWIGMPNIHAPKRADGGPERPSFTQTLKTALRDRRFVTVIALNTGYWFLFVQFTISLPLYVYNRFGSLEAISLYYIINSVPAILAQYFLLQYLNRRWSRPMILLVAMVFISLGIGTIGVWTLPLLVVVSATVYALGDLLYQPTQYTITSELARSDALAAYFGLAAYALAVGGGVGNVLGGWLFDQAVAASRPDLVWYLYGGVGIVIAAGLAIWARGQQPTARTT
ncbi:MAG: MFS transporter [Chloroflexi bacterium]|nr:MFS transporter [Chloroflexota bacterium]